MRKKNNFWKFVEKKPLFWCYVIIGITFSVISIIGLGLNQALMAVFVDLFKIYYMFSKVLITAIVMVYNFVTRKLFLEGK